MGINSSSPSVNVGPGGALYFNPNDPNSISPQVCCTETKTTGCTSCGTNPGDKGSETRNELLNFKMLRPIDHVLNFVIIFSVVSVSVLIGLLIFKKR